MNMGCWVWDQIDCDIVFRRIGSLCQFVRHGYKPADAMSLCEYLNSRTNEYGEGK